MNPSQAYAFKPVAPFVRRATGYDYAAFPLDRPNASIATKYGCMVVSPSTNFASSGNAGGPFSPNALIYTITNIGGNSMDWTLTKINSWVLLSDNSGTLGPGESIDVTVTLAATGLPAATYTDSLVFTNTTNGCGNITIPLSLVVINYTPACFLDLSTVRLGGTGLPYANATVASVAMSQQTSNCLIAYTLASLAPNAAMVGGGLKVVDQLDFDGGDTDRTILTKINAVAGNVLYLSYTIDSTSNYTLTFKLYAANGTTLLSTQTYTTTAGISSGTLSITAPSTACFYLEAKFTHTTVSPTGALTATYVFTSTGSFATVPILAPYTSGLSTLYYTCA